MKIDWLVEYPSRDLEFERALGQEIWMVKYDADHPSMQKLNRLDTCYNCGFLDVVFEDDVFEEDAYEADSEEQWQQETLIICR